MPQDVIVWLRNRIICKGVATKFYLGGGGHGFIGIQAHLNPKVGFSPDFGHFILKTWENAKFSYMSRKKILKYHNFWRDVSRWLFDCRGPPSTPLSTPGLCSTHEPWVKFDSTLTQKRRVRVESAVKMKDMSRVTDESCWLSFESGLSQLDAAWVKVETLIFVKILHLSVELQGKNQPTSTLDRTPPPPPGQQLLAKLGKMWWVVNQIWINSDSNELSRSWVRLANLGF